MYRKIILDALKENADSKDISRMVVLINYKAEFRDFADFNKYDALFWENLAKNIHQNSANPNMAIGPVSIAAGQYLLEGPLHDREKAKELVTLGMSIDSDHKFIQLYAKAIVGMELGERMGKGQASIASRTEMINDCRLANQVDVEQLEKNMLSGDAEETECTSFSTR